MQKSCWTESKICRITEYDTAKQKRSRLFIVIKKKKKRLTVSGAEPGYNCKCINLIAVMCSVVSCDGPAAVMSRMLCYTVTAGPGGPYCCTPEQYRWVLGLIIDFGLLGSQDVK